MRVPLSWLREYVDVDLTPEQLAERLTLLGMEVKGLERWGAEWQHVVVGRLLTVARHPRADRLSLTTVDVGAGEALEIVCGATNIAPGQLVPVALPGAVLPGGRRIERAEKMGVVSNGMLCSGDELELTDDADGILILPDETPIGRDLSELYGDVVLDVDVKPNRGDALSLLGLAREVSAATGAPVRPPVIELLEEGRPAAEELRVDVEDPDLCPRFVGRVVRGVTVAPSPDRVQMRLRAAGQRPVSNVVDVSNYVMLELGKPIHTFDAAAIRDGHLIVRRARRGERLETLDHVWRDLDEDTLVIADPAGPTAIAGVMGGAASEVDDDTRDVAVESAIFDPVSIRRTGQRYGLRSEASLRFEKGLEFRLARIGADRTAQLLAAWAGGTVAPGRVDTNPDEPERARVAFRPARVGRLLGAAIPTAEQRELLGTGRHRDGRGGARDAGRREWRAAAPGRRSLERPSGTRGPRRPRPHLAARSRDRGRRRGRGGARPGLRADARHPAAHDDADVPAVAAPGPRPSPAGARRCGHLRGRDARARVAAGRGALSGSGRRRRGAMVSPARRPRGGEPITITNPLASQHSVLRQRLLGSLLDVVRSNLRQGRDDVAIFEIGKGYGRVDGRPHEWWRLGLALTGAAAPRAWNRSLAHYDLDDAKGLVELLALRSRPRGPDVRSAARAGRLAGVPPGPQCPRDRGERRKVDPSAFAPTSASCTRDCSRSSRSAPIGSSWPRSRCVASRVASSSRFARRRSHASRQSNATSRSSSMPRCRRPRSPSGSACVVARCCARSGCSTSTRCPTDAGASPTGWCSRPRIGR